MFLSSNLFVQWIANPTKVSPRCKRGLVGGIYFITFNKNRKCMKSLVPQLIQYFRLRTVGANEDLFI
jgi:hypothetical protein